MGSVQTKDIITPSSSPVKIQKQITEHSFISPLQRTISATREDPRSPGGRRTPLQSPHVTPNLNKNTRERMMMILNASKSVDPRSPSMVTRTPLNLSAAEGVPRTPPPFRSGDPRSPYMMRTPLALSDAVMVPDDLVIVGQEIGGDPVRFAEEVVIEEGGERIAVGASMEILAASSDSAYNSPSISKELLALAMSPMNSPSIGSRKRKDITRAPGLSPLKKSYSAPMDENTPPSPVNKSITSVARARTPLSPLAMNSKHQYSVGVQPIKFRMDPGILG